LYTIDASPSDPNFYDDNDFKKALGSLLERKKPRLLLDIHASHSHRPYDIDLGTMDGASLLGQEALRRDLIDILHGEGIANVSLDFFSAKKNQTITKFAAALGVPAIQLEINSTWLHPSANDLDAHRFSQLLDALARFAARVQPGVLARAPAVAPLDLSSRACTRHVPVK
jgi:LmbE family N-acetylglucosaminyl deacetylase